MNKVVDSQTNYEYEGPDEGWETVIDFTKFRKGGIPIEELISILKEMSK